MEPGCPHPEDTHIFLYKHIHVRIAKMTNNRLFIKTFIITLLFAALPALAEKQEKTISIQNDCRIEKLSIRSNSMQRDINIVVVLPPEYDSNPKKLYPVLHALHGMSAPYATWSDMSHLRKALKTMPMLVVGFDGDSASWFLDSPINKKSQFKTFFFDELIPWLEKNYRVSDKRGVTGFSMGGYGALYYAFSHPDKFTSASALSGAFNSISERAKRGSGKHLEKLLGTYATHKEEYEQRELRTLLSRNVNGGIKIPALMMRCGVDDSLKQSNRNFVDFIAELNHGISKGLEPQLSEITDKMKRRDKREKLMKEQQVNFEYVETNGAHNWPYWLSESAQIVRFHWNHFQ